MKNLGGLGKLDFLFMLHLLNMNIQEKAAEYVSLYNDLRRIALKLRPIEERFLGMDGLGSAGMQAVSYTHLTLPTTSRV